MSAKARFGWAAAALAGIYALALPAVPDVAGYSFGREPKGLLTAFSQGGMSRGFGWQTDTSVLEGEVRLVRGDAKPEAFKSTLMVYKGTSVVASSPTTHCHRAMVDALAPGKYSCRIGAAGKYLYRKLEVKSPGQKATVVYFSDAQTLNPDTFKVIENTFAASTNVVGGADKVDFLINGGDFVDGWLRKHEKDPANPSTGKPDRSMREYVGRCVEWGIMADVLERYYPCVPMVSSSGNHDFQGYGKHMPVKYPEGVFPGCESLDYGNVHVVAIPFVAGKWTADVRKVLAWLEDDLRANFEKGKSDWTIVCTHWGPYTTGDHGLENPVTANLVMNIGALCARYRVDVVLQAHDHTFSKTLPYRWDAAGWTKNEADDVAVNLAPVQKQIGGESYDCDPNGTYYLATGCAGPRCGENAAYAAATGSKSYRSREYKIVTGKINVDSKRAKKGDDASADYRASMFGVMRIDGRRLVYDWYIVERDGSYSLFDTLRVAKKAKGR